MAWVAIAPWQPQDSVYIRKKANISWVRIECLAFCLIKLAACSFWVTKQSGGLIHYYTKVSVDGKGLNTIIPNLLKVSEQPFVGFHMSHGSLSVLAAGLSWVAHCRWRLVVLCRH